MYLSTYQLSKKKERLFLLSLFTISIIIRIPVVLITGDTSLENEWAILVNNLINHKILAYNYYDGNLDEFLFPSIYMPPLYAYYLYCYSFFNLAVENYIQLILFSQILLSSLSVVIFYEINKIFFSQKLSFFSSVLFSIIPLNLYACGQISSATLQVFFTILFYFLFLRFLKNNNFVSIIYLSIVSGLLILLRGEFVAIFFTSILLLFFLFKESYKKIILIFLIALITTSPYLIRNIIVFEKVTITKSFGYNLWKGNNPKADVEGYSQIGNELKEKIKLITKNKNYGIAFDNIFKEQAMKNIKEDPKKYFNLFVKKFISFLFIDVNSSHPKYYNPLHYIPVLLLSITSLTGIILSNKKSKKLNYLIIIFFINIIIFSCFFILPRYKLAIIPLQIIFTNILITYIKNKFFHRNEY